MKTGGTTCKSQELKKVAPAAFFKRTCIAHISLRREELQLSNLRRTPRHGVTKETSTITTNNNY
jgi:hypothetical protein